MEKSLGISLWAKCINPGKIRLKSDNSFLFKFPVKISFVFNFTSSCQILICSIIILLFSVNLQISSTFSFEEKQIRKNSHLFYFVLKFPTDSNIVRMRLLKYLVSIKQILVRALWTRDDQSYIFFLFSFFYSVFSVFLLFKNYRTNSSGNARLK